MEERYWRLGGAGCRGFGEAVCNSTVILVAKAALLRLLAIASASEQLLLATRLVASPFRACVLSPNIRVIMASRTAGICRITNVSKMGCGTEQPVRARWSAGDTFESVEQRHMACQSVHFIRKAHATCAAHLQRNDESGKHLGRE